MERCTFGLTTSVIPSGFKTTSRKCDFFKLSASNEIVTGEVGARYLTGENLKVVWAEFSILS